MLDPNNCNRLALIAVHLRYKGQHLRFMLEGLEPDHSPRLIMCQLMTENPKTISPTASLIDAARFMLGDKISALPVLDGDKPVGIITESDVFRAFVEFERRN